MDLWDILKVAGRQWRVLIPLLVLTFAVALFAGASLNPEHVANGAVVLVGPNEIPGTPAVAASQPGQAATPAGAATPVNPYLSFSSSLPVTASALSLRIQNSQTKDTLESDGLSTNYEILVDPRSPIVGITARAESAADAVDTLNAVIDIAGEELTRLQVERDAPENQLINLDVLEASTEAAQDSAMAMKVRLGIFGIGLIGSITIAYATEGLLSIRRRRKGGNDSGGGGRHARHAAPADPGTAEASEDEPLYGPAPEPDREPVSVSSRSDEGSDPGSQPWGSWSSSPGTR